VGAASGATPAPKGYFPAIRALCDRYDILLHLDEIMCGMGRTGTYFAFEHEAIQPDIVTIGKGLGGGYSPIGGMLINRKIVETLRQGSSVFNNGQTYQAHPVSCAIALSVQRILRREKLVARVASLGPKLEKKLRDAFEGCRYVADIRGRGFFWGIVFMLDAKNKESFPADWNFGLRVQQRAFELGVAIYPGAGDFVLICPSYTVTEEELDISVKTTRKAYDEVAAAYQKR
jgi:adenosylmethionine-8-amino-7-oxononanoate aminotransferase